MKSCRLGPLPLPPVLVELGRCPAGKDVVGHVVVGVHKAGENVGVGYCDAGGIPVDLGSSLPRR